MNILVVTTEWPTAANKISGIHVVQQINALRELGVQVDVFHFKGNKNPLRYLWAAFKFKQIDLNQYDLIHAHHGQSGVVALSQRKLPVVVTYHGTDLQGIRKAGNLTVLGKILRHTSQWVAKHTDGIIVVAEHMSRLLPEGKPYTVIPCGIDLDTFRYQSQTEARKKLDIPPEKRLILFVGRPSRPEKNFKLAKEAVELLKPKINVEIQIAQDVPNALMPAYMNACDVLLITSTSEGSPTVVKEALACNLAIVSVDVGDVKSRITAVEGCYICPDYEAQSIAHYLYQALETPYRINGSSATPAIDQIQLSKQVIRVYQNVLNETTSQLNPGAYVIENDAGYTPPVTVIIPLRNEAKYIERCLHAIQSQDYPAEQVEILVVDGLSDDGTREIIAQTAESDPRIRLLDNPQRIVPTGMNIGIRQAQGDIIVRVDGRCIIAPDYVRQCVELLQYNNVQNVGGSQQPVGDDFLTQTIALASTSPFGAGPATFRQATKETLADTVYLGAYPKQALLEIGLYDEEMVRNQDYELNYRLIKSGGKILYSPLIKSVYYGRSSIKSLWKQYFQYGFWKTRTLQKHPESLKWRQLVAPAFVFSLISGIVFSPFKWGRRWLAAAAGSYALASLFVSAKIARKSGWKYLPQLPLIFGAMHLGWGSGFLVGFAKNLFSSTGRKS